VDSPLSFGLDARAGSHVLVRAGSRGEVPPHVSTVNYKFGCAMLISMAASDVSRSPNVTESRDQWQAAIADIYRRMRAVFDRHALYALSLHI